jgi:hypothetical protein
VTVGNSFVEVGIVASGSSDGAGGLFVGDDWALASEVADGRLDVFPCWLHPHRDKPTTVLAAAIRILRNDLILVLLPCKPAFVGDRAPLVSSARWGSSPVMAN